MWYVLEKIKEMIMPMGKGTYGSKVGRPSKKKNVESVIKAYGEYPGIIKLQHLSANDQEFLKNV